MLVLLVRVLRLDPVLVLVAMASLRQVLVAALKSLLRGKSFLQALFAFWLRPTALAGSVEKGARTSRLRCPDDFLHEAEHLFLQSISDADRLHHLAMRLKTQFHHGLLTSPASMLPSYNHQLPTGAEQGQYLALDVGGSTLRVALVRLDGSLAHPNQSLIVRLDSFKIDPAIKDLEGSAFFLWMAQRIVDTIAQHLDGAANTPAHPLLMGLAWSFPIE